MLCTARLPRPCAKWTLNPPWIWAICILMGDARVWWCPLDVCAPRKVVGTCRGVFYVTNSRKFPEGWQHFRLIFSVLNSFFLSPVSLCYNAVIGWVSNGSTWFKIIPNQEHKVFIQQLLHTLLVQLSSYPLLFIMWRVTCAWKEKDSNSQV